MVIEPKVKAFICTTAHPAGCRAAVQAQIDYVKAQPKTVGPKKVLVIGCSMGYGLASRIAAAYSCGADTLGIIFDKPAKGKRTATAGWYNTAAFEQIAQADGLYAKTLNGDAYSAEMKEQTIETIKKDLGQVDMVIYSIAAPRRTAPDVVTYKSVLKTTGEAYTNRTIDLRSNQLTEATIEPATQEAINNTIKVMGGEDWILWIKALKDAGVLADGAKTVAYSYIGPELTYPIYKEGSIGQAKKDLYASADKIQEEVDGVEAYVSVNKAVVTQSSAAIPIVPLYLAILFKVMKEQNVQEGCIEQMYRMIHDRLCNGGEVVTDENRLIRMDDWEMEPKVQEAVAAIWEKIDQDNLEEVTDLEGYWQEFYEIFGFCIDGVDYSADVDADVQIPSIAPVE